MIKQKRNWLIAIILAILALGVIIYFAFYFYNKNKTTDNNIDKDEKPVATNNDANNKAKSDADKSAKSNGQSTTSVDLSAVQTLYDEQNYDQALVEIAKITPLTAEVYNLWGNILRDLGDTDGAKIKYGQAISLDASLIVTYTNLATIYQNEGNIDKAKEILNQGLAANPGNGDLQNSLVILEITPRDGN